MPPLPRPLKAAGNLCLETVMSVNRGPEHVLVRPQVRGVPRTDGQTSQRSTLALLALAAPRPFILCNALNDQYGNASAAVQTYLDAKPVHALLGAPDNLGIHFRPGQHGMNDLDWQAILDFADQKLKKLDVKRRFDQLPPAGQAPQPTVGLDHLTCTT